jgi:hypothetical protein
METQDINLNLIDLSKTTITTEIVDVSSNLIVYTFVKLLQSKLSDTEFGIKVNLNADSLAVLNLVLSKCPQVIDSIGIHIKKIMSDKVINLSDIPEIILLVQDVLNTNVNELNKIKVTRGQVIQMIKNIFIILIESNEIKTTPETKENCLILLDLSIKLLESKVNVQKVIKCRLFR